MTWMDMVAYLGAIHLGTSLWWDRKGLDLPWNSWTVRLHALGLVLCVAWLDN